MAMPRRNPDPSIAPSELELINAARSGSPEALGQLFDRHASGMLAIAFRLLQSADDAEDVVHDVFVGLPEALRRYEERGAFEAWLKKVTARVALTRIREIAGHKTISLDDLSSQPTEAARDVEGVISLEQAMRDLSPSLRAVLVLKEIEGFSHAEIALMLDISVGASEVRRHRAIQSLREMLTRGEHS